jgi:hypothetical protein
MRRRRIAIGWMMVLIALRAVNAALAMAGLAASGRVGDQSLAA